MSDYSAAQGFAVPKPTKKIKQKRQTGNKYKDASITQEDQLAYDLTTRTGIDFERVKMSGANKEKPGDARTNRRVRNPSHKFLIEAKLVDEITSRGETQVTISKLWLDKIILEASQENSIPMLVVQFRGDEHRFSMLRFDDITRLLAEHKSMADILDA